MNKYTIEKLQEMAIEVNGWDGSLKEFEYYKMEQINELFHSVEPLEILRMAQFGEFNCSDDYFTINAYGNLESTSENDFHGELIDNLKEIVERYNKLVESGDIENIL